MCKSLRPTALPRALPGSPCASLPQGIWALPLGLPGLPSEPHSSPQPQPLPLPRPPPPLSYFCRCCLCRPCGWPLTTQQLYFQGLRLSSWPCTTQLKLDPSRKPFLAPWPVRGAPVHTHTLTPMHGRTWCISHRMVLLRGKDHVTLTSASPVCPAGLGTQ